MKGRFVWHELMTTDPKGAIAFYSEAVGWKTELFGEPVDGHPPYTMWVGDQGPLGGVMTLPEEVKKMGAPPHWMGHVQVADVDASVQTAEGAGGSVMVPPTSVPTVGRFSVIADPQGATLSIFQPEMEMAQHEANRPGEFNWGELIANDAPTAFPFYEKLFGWEKVDELDMGEMGKYLVFGQGDVGLGGMMSKPPEMPLPPTWLYYVHVDDLDAAIARATNLGAKMFFGPIEVPNDMHIAQLTDPQGATFALHGPRK